MNRIRHVIMVLGMLLASCGAVAPAAADTRVGAHLGSYHFEGNFNNFNPGVYVYHDGWTAGTYYNSERNQSYYAGYTFEYPLVGPFTGGLTVGAITGYSRASVMPLAVPSIAWRTSGDSRLALRVSFVPKVEKGGSSAVHASIEFKFN